MFEYKVRNFFKNCPTVIFDEEQISPVLIDFLEECYTNKCKMQRPFTEKIPSLNSTDKDIILKTKKSYNLGIDFCTNELCQHLADKEAITDTIDKIALFCINPNVFDRSKGTVSNTVVSPLFAYLN